MHPFFDLLSPHLLFSVLFALCVVAVVILSLGKRLEQYVPWLAVTAVAILVLVMSVNFWTTQQSNADSYFYWSSGWIWARNEAMSITLGFQRDAIGTLTGLLTVWLTLGVVLTLFGPAGFGSDQKDAGDRRRTLAGVLLACSGSVMMCLISTPWLGIVGMVLTILAGVLVLGGDREDEQASRWVTRYFTERLIGVLIAIIGASVLLGAGVRLGFSSEEAPLQTVTWGASEKFGVVLFLIGLFLQMVPFPLLGTKELSFRRSPAQNTVAFVLPAWATLVFLVQAEGLLRAAGVLEPFAGFTLAFSLLTSVGGVLQVSVRHSLRFWTLSVYALLWAVFAFSGAEAALLMGASMAVGSTVFEILSHDQYDSGEATDRTLGRRAIQTSSHPSGKLGRISFYFGIAVAASVGLPGFAGAGGVMRALLVLTERPMLVAFLMLGLLCSLVLAWRTAWLTCREAHDLTKKTGAVWRPSNASLISMIGLLLVAVAPWWTGSISGWVLPPGIDQVFPSFWSNVGGHAMTGKEFSANPDVWVTWGSVYFGLLLVSFFTAFWTSGRANDQMERFSQSFPRGYRFITQSYGIEMIRPSAARGLTWFGSSLVRGIDRKGWELRIPAVASWTISRVSDSAMKLDRWVVNAVVKTMRWTIEMGGRGVQITQNGNVQTYLMVALVAGLLVILQAVIPKLAD